MYIHIVAQFYCSFYRAENKGDGMVIPSANMEILN